MDDPILVVAGGVAGTIWVIKKYEALLHRVSVHDNWKLVPSLLTGVHGIVLKYSGYCLDDTSRYYVLLLIGSIMAAMYDTRRSASITAVLGLPTTLRTTRSAFVCGILPGITTFISVLLLILGVISDEQNKRRK